MFLLNFQISTSGKKNVIGFGVEKKRDRFAEILCEREGNSVEG